MLPPSAALVAAGVWLFNFHAVNMAVLWLSGRTSLLVSLFSLAKAHAMLAGRPLMAGGLALLAMLSKEEAVALPALFSAWTLLWEPRVRSVVRTLPMWGALLVYIALRLQSGAFWATDAPAYYRFSSSPGLVARNAFEYADRAGTVAAVVIVALAVLTRIRMRHFTPDDRRILSLAGLWVAATYALTLFLPVRSSLYALLPSIGAGLAAGVVASTAALRNPRVYRYVTAGLLMAVFALSPVYRSRNARWVGLADLSEQVMTTIARDASGRTAGHVVLVDSPAERFNLQSAFGGLFPEAMRLRVGEGWTGEVVTPSGAQQPGDLSYRLSDGALVRAD